jgi:hypothetical protein
MTEESEFDPWQGQDIFLFTASASWTKPAFCSVGTKGCFPRVKTAGNEAYTYRRGKYGRSCNFIPHTLTSSWHGA